MIYGDGEQTRDFTFVKDVVSANILAAKSDAEGVYNIANGNRISINQLEKDQLPDSNDISFAEGWVNPPAKI